MKRLVLALAILSVIAVPATAWFRHAGPYPAINVYFSSSTGNDNNACTSGSPCQTIAKANTLFYGAGSTLNFLKGDTFTTTVPLQLWGPASNHATGVNVFGVLTVSTYGGGTCNVIAGTISGCANIQMSGGVTQGIYADTTTGTTIENIRVLGGAGFLTAFQGSMGIYYNNNKGVSTGLVIENDEVVDTALEIELHVNAGSISGATIEDNYVHGSTSSSTVDMGIFTQGLVVGNSLIQGNLVTNIGGHNGGTSGYYDGGSGNGILISNGGSTLMGILDQFNVVHDYGLNTNTCGGPAANWTFGINGATLQFNESYNGGPTIRPASSCDWDGFDIDGGNIANIVQYNYAHNNLGGDYIVNVEAAQGNTWAGNIIRYNIAEEATSGRTNYGNCFFIGGSNESYDLTSAIYNNSCTTDGDNANSVPPADGWCMYLLASYNMVFANNICVNTGVTGASLMWYYGFASPLFVSFNNDYYRAHSASNPLFSLNHLTYTTTTAFNAGTGQEANSVLVNPKLTSNVGGGTCYSSGTPAGPQPCPSSYVLQAGSPMIGAGASMAAHGFTPGIRDYYGNTIPNIVGSGFNIGGDGGNP